MSAMKPGMVAVACALLAFICFTSVASAQTGWLRSYGAGYGAECYSVQQTTDGGYVIVGRAWPDGSPNLLDVYLIRTNGSGDTLWTRTYGGAGIDIGQSVEQTSDGGFVIAGLSDSYGDGSMDVFLLKTDDLGEALWIRTYGGEEEDRGMSCQQTADSGYVIAGWTHSFGAKDRNMYLIKTNTQGDTLWTKTYGGPGYDGGCSVQQTSDGGYVVVGGTQGADSSYRDGDVYLVKTNAQGDTLWTRAHGGPSDDEGHSVRQTWDGGYIISGWTSGGYGIQDSGAIRLMKTSDQGDTLWTRAYGVTAGPWYGSVQQTSDGGYFVTGYVKDFVTDNKDIYLVKTDAQGNTLWTKTYGWTENEWGMSGRQTADGGYIIACNTNSFGDDGNICLIKTDSLGRVGVSEQKPRSRAIGCRPAATVIRSLPQGTSAFDAMGRRVVHPHPGVYFLKTSAIAAPRKILLLR